MRHLCSETGGLPELESQPVAIRMPGRAEKIETVGKFACYERDISLSRGGRQADWHGKNNCWIIMAKMTVVIVCPVTRFSPPREKIHQVSEAFD